MIRELQARGSRVAVWTNRDLESASLILEHSGLGELMEACVSGTCVTLRKPEPEGLLRIIDRFGCRADEVTMVGDHEHDVTAAKRVGARAVRASWHAYWDEAPCPTADAQFRSVAEFQAWAL
jgi:phosphoglycolate phosphatase